MKHQQVRTYLISAVFLLMLAFPLLNYYTGLVKDIPSFENRAPAKEPKFNIKKADPFPALYETFFNDHFPLRNSLIKNYSIYKLLFFKQSPFPEAVIVGSDKWLYQAADELDVFTGKTQFNDSILAEFKSELEYRKKYLEERGCKFYLMVVPCKAVVHSEHLGLQYYRMNSISIGEQLNNYLVKNSSIKPIDLFTVLKARKKNKDVYYKMDNHWNKLGALYSANEAFKQMNADFGKVDTLSYNSIKEMPIKSPDLLKMIGNVSFLKEFENEPVLPNGFKAEDVGQAGYTSPKDFAYSYLFEQDKEKKDSLKNTLLVVSDSFGENIFPYLAENFSRTVKIWDAWQYKLNEDIVSAEKPKAFLLIVHEKNLKLMLKYRSEPKK